jgi:PhnB protein
VIASGIGRTPRPHIGPFGRAGTGYRIGIAGEAVPLSSWLRGLGTRFTADRVRKDRTMQVQPYLFFDGSCQEAIDFYRTVLGAEVLMQMAFKDSPVPTSQPSVPGDKVMHACLRIGETQVMMSDGMCGGKPAFQGFSLSLTLTDDAEAERLFAALADGGAVNMPLAKTFFASSFGMVNDRFGVSWMVMVPA